LLANQSGRLCRGQFRILERLFEMTLIIRMEQLEALATGAYDDFETRLARHLNKFFPETMAEQSSEAIRDFINECVKGAAHYGLTTEQAVACFAHLPLLLGPEFESDRRWAFIPATLAQPAVDPTDRAKFAMILAYAIKERYP
jgi:hypothetical protein